MKKTFCLMLLCVLTCACLMVGSASADKVAPNRVRELPDMEHCNLQMHAYFDPFTDIDSDGNITVTLQAEEFYAASDVQEAKPGDIIEAYGAESVIAQVETNEDGNILIYVEDGEVLYEFFYYDENTMFTSDCDMPSRAELGNFTFLLAKQVKLTTWYLTDEGIPSVDLKTEVFPAEEVQAYLLARDDTQEDYLDCEGDYVTVTVTNGQVTEITIGWGSDY